MKIFVSVLTGILIAIGSISEARAAGSVKMTATVVERKSTDTINDFDFSSLTGQPKVLGASTVAVEPVFVNKLLKLSAKDLWQKIINLLKA